MYVCVFLMYCIYVLYNCVCILACYLHKNHGYYTQVSWMGFSMSMYLIYAPMLLKARRIHTIFVASRKMSTSMRLVAVPQLLACVFSLLLIKVPVIIWHTIHAIHFIRVTNC